MRIIRTFDAVSRRKESIESLDKVGIAAEQSRHAINNPGSIDTTISIHHRKGRGVTFDF
jgi:hypothetical protein